MVDSFSIELKNWVLPILLFFQEEERFVNTPTKETRTTKIKTITTAEKLDEPCDISRLIENRLCAASPRVSRF